MGTCAHAELRMYSTQGLRKGVCTCGRRDAALMTAECTASNSSQSQNEFRRTSAQPLPNSSSNKSANHCDPLRRYPAHAAVINNIGLGTCTEWSAVLRGDDCLQMTSGVSHAVTRISERLRQFHVISIEYDVLIDDFRTDQG